LTHNIKKKLDADNYSFLYFTVTLWLHYLMQKS